MVHFPQVSSHCLKSPWDQTALTAVPLLDSTFVSTLLPADYRQVTTHLSDFSLSPVPHHWYLLLLLLCLCLSNLSGTHP